MYLLDTNVVSELRKAGSNKIDQNVLAWANRVPSSDLYISVITALELEMGVLQVERKDSQQGSLLRDWLNNHVLPVFADRTLDIDTSIALQCAQLHIPDPRSDRDSLIAASALVHDMIVVTRNIRDFEATGIELINPWNESAI